MENSSSQHDSFFWLRRRGSAVQSEVGVVVRYEVLTMAMWRGLDQSEQGLRVIRYQDLFCLPSPLWPTKHSHILDLIYITHHPALVSGHLWHHHIAGKEMQ